MISKLIITTNEGLQRQLHRLVLWLYACCGRFLDYKIAAEISPKQGQKLTADSFPVQLGYGQLERGSIRVKDAGLVADYYVFDRKAFEVTMYSFRCMIKDVWPGKENSVYCFNLPTAANLFFRSQLLSPAMRFLMSKVCSLGNVCFCAPEITTLKHYTYPEAFHFILRLPASHKTLLKMADLIEYKHYLYTFYYDCYETIFTGINWDGEMTDDKMVIVEYKVSVCRLYEFVKYLVKHQLIRSGQYRQLVIQEIGEKSSGSIVSFSGREDEPWQLYFIRYKPLSENAICKD